MIKSLKAGLILTIACANYLFAGNVTDTIHAKRYSIYIDTLNYAKQSIKGHTYITIQSKLNGVTNISIDLLKLLVDSVSSNGTPLQYNYNDTVLRIQPPSSMNS